MNRTQINTIMTKNLIFSALFLVAILIFSCDEDKRNTTFLKGKVIDRTSETLVLKKSTQDFRNSGLEITIDENGNFNHEMQYDFIEVYELIFKDELNSGMWRPVQFLPESDTIKFTLYPIEKFEENTVVGSSLSLEEDIYNQIIKDKFFNRYNLLNQKKDSLYKIGQIESDYYKSLTDSINLIITDISNFELNYFNSKTNLFGYGKFLEILRVETDRQLFDIDTLKRYANLFSKNIPNHPYNQIAQLRLDALTKVKVGGQYIDFSAKDSLGEIYTLSRFIDQNELTLIDLWAPWCAPCIKKSKAILPLYEELTDSNFQVIGVIGGIKTENQYLETLKKYNYPWIQLAEISDEHNIWEKYNISNQGGAQILVDKTGTILAINPELSELKAFIVKI